MTADSDETIERVEERVTVGKKVVTTGHVRVSTSSHLVEDIAAATLSGVRVEVTRKRLDRPIETVPEVRIEGDTTIIPVVEEILVVEKRLVLVEEIFVRRVETTEDVEVPVTLRKQSVTVERIEE
ncbi:YsnF/AvaK domain-containing protein [Rhizobium sp. YIM 134829]|uniref:YsnF/AvaK domain-containing protein n=1 Tax=Rhizobium sp. YIM 134829 TaxID=3390453 RepID=UPI00397DF87B